VTDKRENLAGRDYPCGSSASDRSINISKDHPMIALPRLAKSLLACVPGCTENSAFQEQRDKKIQASKRGHCECCRPEEGDGCAGKFSRQTTRKGQHRDKYRDEYKDEYRTKRKSNASCPAPI